RSKRDWSSDVCSSDLDPAAVFLKDFRCRKAVIGGAVHTVFLLYVLQGQGPFSIQNAGGHRTGVQFKQIGIIFTGMDLFAKVELRSDERRVGKECECRS